VRLAGPPRQSIILFDHDPSRSSEVASRLLKGAHGVIQSDGCSAYEQVAKHFGLVRTPRIRGYLLRDLLPENRVLPNLAANASAAQSANTLSFALKCRFAG
jgi:hypothetical protein